MNVTEQLIEDLEIVLLSWRRRTDEDMKTYLPAPAAQAHGRTICTEDIEKVLAKYRFQNEGE